MKGIILLPKQQSLHLQRKWSTSINQKPTFQKNTFLFTFQNKTKYFKVSSIAPLGSGLEGVRLFSTPKDGSQTPVPDVVSSTPPVEVSTAIESLERFTQTVPPVSSGPGIMDWFQPVQWSVDLLEQIHLITGTPWWATIVLTTFSLRLLLFPLGVKAARHSAKVNELQPQMSQVQAELMKAKSSGNIEKEKQLAQDFSALLLQANPFKTLLYIMPQAPIFVCMFLALRKLAENHPDLHNGGILWFTDLAAADPYLRLPILSGLGFILAFEVGADAGAPAGDPRKKMMRYIMYPMMAAVVWGTSHFPQAVHLYWLTSSMIGILQVALFRQPTIQKALNLPPRRPHNPVPLPALPTNVVFQPARPEVPVATLNPKKLSKKHNDRSK